MVHPAASRQPGEPFRQTDWRCNVDAGPGNPRQEARDHPNGTSTGRIDPAQSQRNYALASECAKTYTEQYPEGIYERYLRKWIDAHKPPPPDVEQEMSRLRCQYIRGELSNSYINPGLWSHDIVIKMDEEAFSESSVREVAEVLSRKYKEPRDLVIYVITIYEQMPGGPSHAQPPEEYYKHHRAVYNRTKNEEYFEYTEGPTDVVMKRVGLN